MVVKRPKNVLYAVTITFQMTEFATSVIYNPIVLKGIKNAQSAEITATIAIRHTALNAQLVTCKHLLYQYKNASKIYQEDLSLQQLLQFVQLNMFPQLYLMV